MKIAIVGGGISGLTCAHYLNAHHDITLFDANSWTGGHTHTVDVESGGQSWAIDTGFIVFNDRTYPGFEALLDELGVAREATEMSFSVHDTASGLEYNGHNLNTLFAQRRNLFSPSFLRMVSDITRFNRNCKARLNNVDEHMTLGDFVAEGGYSRAFRDFYLLPMVAAIWSCNESQAQAFPLAFFIRFFNNHGLLNIVDRPQWYVVKGGSRSYVQALAKRLQDRLRAHTPVNAVERHEDEVIVRLANGEHERFDQVILACHSDQALKLLNRPTDAEVRILGDIHYSDNEVVLHQDMNLMPRRQAAHAAWNYRLSPQNRHKPTVTYYMNRLQNLPADAPPFLVTLNDTAAIEPDNILETFHYTHPVYNRTAFAAQKRWSEISGKARTHFCGAYWLNGFHEDGVQSGLRVCRALGLHDS